MPTSVVKTEYTTGSWRANRAPPPKAYALNYFSLFLVIFICMYNTCMCKLEEARGIRRWAVVTSDGARNWTQALRSVICTINCWAISIPLRFMLPIFGFTINLPKEENFLFQVRLKCLWVSYFIYVLSLRNKSSLVWETIQTIEKESVLSVGDVT